MNTNDNFNSKKIIEEIENLENNPESKTENVKSAISKFFETLILVVLIGIVFMVVITSFFEEIFGVDESDYEYESESVYYDSELDSSYDDYSYVEEEETNTSVTLEEFFSSEVGNKMLTESVQNLANNEVSDNVTENNIVEENTETVENQSEQISESTEDENNMEMLEIPEFEKLKKNLIIKEEGKSVNKELIFSIENKNFSLVNDFMVCIVFYQEDDIVGIDIQDIDLIVSNNKKYLKAKEMPETYDRYQFFIEKYDDNEYSDTILNNNISFESYIKNELVEIEITNNANKKINRVEFTILYYDSERNILDIDNVSDYNIWRAGNVTGYGVWNEELEEYMQYSDYEVILDSAERYN